jgi:Spy/CpxP family protein refolding chaperone
MKMDRFVTSLIAGSILFSAATTFAAMPKTGDAAPSFAGRDQDGKIVHATNVGSSDIHFNEMKDAIAGLKKGLIRKSSLVRNTGRA